MRKFVTVGVGVLVPLAAIIATATSLFMLSALPEPGRTETFVATRAKHFLVRRKAFHQPLPSKRPAPRKARDSFGTECGACHGNSGHSPTDAGRWMYPRAADLTSRDAQSYSDQELFWIIKNGIRLSGMPAFGKVESDDHIWDLVFYVRALPKVHPQSKN
jgi:cytochrome c553